MAIALTDGCQQLLDFQHGVIARWQVPATGPEQAAMHTLVRSGRWRQLYRGVYASFTGDPPRNCLLWAAVLRAGPGAVLSHYTAAELDHLTDQPSTALHVTVDHLRRIAIPGQVRSELAPPIVVHRSRRIDQARHPVRSPPRTRIEETVLDLTQVAASFDRAFGWLSAACGRRLVMPQQLMAAVTARPRLRWRPEILAAIETVAEGVHSNLEFRYVRGVERPHGLPAARRQAKVTRQGRSQYFDNLYQPYGVAVELDGVAAHLTENRWRDIHRDNRDAQAGIITLRYSWTDVTCRRCEVADEVASVLRLRNWPGPFRSCSPACHAAAR
jgi:hypothetical protein